MVAKLKERKIAALLALVSAIPFLPSGLHKFYLGQPRWGIVYLLLSFTYIPKIASALEGIWYLFQEREEFNQHFNTASMTTVALATAAPGTVSPLSTPGSIAPLQVKAIADALRQLEQLRQEGLISEYEFEQKRRQLLDQMG
ncbi:MAG: hypothetical protein Kow00121_31280 [Elainellaceae cyanobacterium]